jgi:hypothetical protein
VTGKKVNGRWTGPNKNFTTPVGPDKLARIVDAFINYLPDADTNYMNFTSANRKAYSSKRGLAFLDAMIANGGVRIGGTIFGNMSQSIPSNLAGKKSSGQAGKPKSKETKP